MAKLGVIGAGGRMGREILAAIAREPGAMLAGAVEHADHPCVGSRMAGGLMICSNPLALAHAADVLIDFTTPDALAQNLEAAQAARHAIVIGTTGLDQRHHKAIDAAARTIPVLQAANTSVGMTWLLAMLERMAGALDGWDAEVLELHHAGKADAPSGTALMLGEVVARSRGERRMAAMPRAIRGTGARLAGEVGYAVLRGGGVAGEHTVYLLGPGERIELTHRAESRAVFAQGAVRAAQWLAGRPAGRYAMADVLGLA